MNTIPMVLIVVGFGVLFWAWLRYRKEGGSFLTVGFFWTVLTPAGTRLYWAGLVLVLLGMSFLFVGT